MGKFLIHLAGWLLSALLLVSSGPGAEEDGGRLRPGRAALHASILSPADLLEGLAGFIPAVAAGSDSEFLLGMLLGSSQAGLRKLPKKAVLLDEEIHLLLTTIQAEDNGWVVLFRADSFADFLDGVGEMGIEAEKSGADGAIIAFNEKNSFFALDLGEGRIALAFNRHNIEYALEMDKGQPVFPPAHPADSLLRVAVSRQAVDYAPGQAKAILDELLRGSLDEIKPPSQTQLEEIPEYLRNLIKWDAATEAIKKTLPAALDKIADIVEELEKAKSLRLDVSLDGRRLALALGLETTPGSHLGRTAASLAKLGRVENALAARIDQEATLLQLAAPIESALPGARELIPAWIGDLIRPAFPEAGQALAGLTAGVIRRASGGGVTASWFDEDGNQTRLNLWKSSDPGADLTAFSELPGILNAMLNRTLDASRSGLNFTGEPVADPDGVFFRLDIKADSELAEIIQEALGHNANLPGLEEIIENAASFIGKQGDTLVVLGGKKAADPEFRRLALELASETSGGENSFIANPRAKKVLGELRHAQGGATLVDMKKMFDLALKFIVMGFRESQLPTAYLEDFEVGFDAMEELAGVGFGVDGDEVLSLEYVVPVKAINAVVRGYEAIASGIRGAGDDAEAGNGYDGDEGDEEGDEEDGDEVDGDDDEVDDESGDGGEA